MTTTLDTPGERLTPAFFTCSHTWCKALRKQIRAVFGCPLIVVDCRGLPLITRFGEPHLVEIQLESLDFFVPTLKPIEEAFEKL